jgi:hypothetical protein
MGKDWEMCFALNKLLQSVVTLSVYGRASCPSHDGARLFLLAIGMRHPVQLYDFRYFDLSVRTSCSSGYQTYQYEARNQAQEIRKDLVSSIGAVTVCPAQKHAQDDRAKDLTIDTRIGTSYRRSCTMNRSKRRSRKQRKQRELRRRCVLFG